MSEREYCEHDITKGTCIACYEALRVLLDDMRDSLGAAIEQKISWEKQASGAVDKLDIAVKVMKQNFEVPNPKTAYVLTSNGTPMGLSKKREKEVLKAFKELGITERSPDDT
jgi:hypothetical protein